MHTTIGMHLVPIPMANIVYIDSEESSTIWVSFHSQPISHFTIEDSFKLTSICKSNYFVFSVIHIFIYWYY